MKTGYIFHPSRTFCMTCWQCEGTGIEGGKKRIKTKIKNKLKELYPNMKDEEINCYAQNIKDIDFRYYKLEEVIKECIKTA